jgi:hypothetical protein
MEKRAENNSGWKTIFGGKKSNYSAGGWNAEKHGEYTEIHRRFK